MVSPLNQTWKSWEERRWSPTKAALDCETNSPCQPLWKCLEKSKENVHTDVRVKGKWFELRSNGQLCGLIMYKSVTSQQPEESCHNNYWWKSRGLCPPPPPPKQKLWTLGEKDRVRDPPPTFHLLHTCFELKFLLQEQLKTFLSHSFNCSMRFVLHKIICLLMHWISGLQPQ